MKRKLAFVVTAIALVAGSVFAAPTAAHAIPSNCHADTFYRFAGEGAMAICFEGSGHYRAIAYCTDNPSTGYGGYAYGPWQRVGQTYSDAYCPSERPFVVDGGYELANW